MGRKRNQGKARRAAKAKAREEAERRRESNKQTANSSGQLLSAQLLQSQFDEKECMHGFDSDSFEFMRAFDLSFLSARRNSDGRTLRGCIADAKKATMDKFADAWNDFNMIDTAMSFFLGLGTQQYLDGMYDDARLFATYARYFEQYIAVAFKQTQALQNWPKIEDTYVADDHTLVKFFRNRIPCSCLDEKYQEVKNIPKMGYCVNPQCSIADKRVERSKAKYCSRCRCVTFCSRECQVAVWSMHKSDCDKFAEIIAEFQAEPDNM